MRYGLVNIDINENEYEYIFKHAIKDNKNLKVTAAVISYRLLSLNSTLTSAQWNMARQTPET